jgi:acyl-CoA thioester hydrolase
MPDPAIDLSGFRVRAAVDVRFNDIDGMGHVNNACYLAYLEQGRIEYWRQLTGGDDLSDFNYIIARVEIDYRHPIGHCAQVLVHLRVAELGRKSYVVEYAITSVDGARLHATARSVQVMFDYRARQTVPIDQALRDRIERFERRART